MFFFFPLTTNRQTERMATSADKFEEFRKYATEGPWETISDENGMLISRRSVPGTSLYTQRGITVINAPVLRVRELIENVEARPKWDSMVAKGEMVRRVNENHVVARFTTEAQWPVAAREFYVEVVADVEPSGKQTILANTPADHETQFPVKDDYVRGVAQNSGYIIEPVPGSEPEQTKIIFLTQCLLFPSTLLAVFAFFFFNAFSTLSSHTHVVSCFCLWDTLGAQWTQRAGSRPPSSRLRSRATRCASAPSRRCARTPTPSERPLGVCFSRAQPLFLLRAHVFHSFSFHLTFFPFSSHHKSLLFFCCCVCRLFRRCCCCCCCRFRLFFNSGSIRSNWSCLSIGKLCPDAREGRAARLLDLAAQHRELLCERGRLSAARAEHLLQLGVLRALGRRVLLAVDTNTDVVQCTQRVGARVREGDTHACSRPASTCFCASADCARATSANRARSASWSAPNARMRPPSYASLMRRSSSSSCASASVSASPILLQLPCQVTHSAPLCHNSKLDVFCFFLGLFLCSENKSRVSE